MQHLAGIQEIKINLPPPIYELERLMNNFGASKEWEIYEGDNHSINHASDRVKEFLKGRKDIYDPFILERNGYAFAFYYDGLNYIIEMTLDSNDYNLDE